MSSHPFMFSVNQAIFRKIKVGQLVRALVLTAFSAFLIASHSSAAYGQSPTFTLTTLTPLTPSAVDAGGVATAVMDLGGDSSVGTVTLSCAVTSSISTTEMPQCQISSESETPPATPSLTVTTKGGSPAGQYSITVTGTAAGLAPVTATLFLDVVEAEQNYTLTVSKPISPGTVTPGGGAEATITVTPISGYSGTVTLSCLSVTPTVVASPYCSFQSDTTPAQPSVQVSSGAAATATLTINTYGTQQTTAELVSPRIFYTLWLGLPGVALVGVGAGRRSRKLFGVLMLLIVLGCVLIAPACGGSSAQQNNTYGYITPKNTYMFTLTGADENGVAPSNATGSQATVSLTVN